LLLLAEAGGGANGTAVPGLRSLRHIASCCTMPSPILICGSDGVSLSFFS
jgi:hypothetical protein